MIEKRGHIVYFVSEFSAADSMKPNKLKRNLETAHAECVGKHLNFFIGNWVIISRNKDLQK
jgi:hypothetical protein